MALLNTFSVGWPEVPPGSPSSDQRICPSARTYAQTLWVASACFLRTDSTKAMASDTLSACCTWPMNRDFLSMYSASPYPAGIMYSDICHLSDIFLQFYYISICQ